METIFIKVPVSKSPKEGQVVFTIDKGHKRVLCVFEDGNFYRRTDDSGNDRLIRFYYPDVTHWLEEVEMPDENELESAIDEHMKSLGIMENRMFARHDWMSGMSWLLGRLLKK